MHILIQIGGENGHMWLKIVFCSLIGNVKVKYLSILFWEFRTNVLFSVHNLWYVYPVPSEQRVKTDEPVAEKMAIHARK